MAIKGLVDTQAYVVGDYQTPFGYFTPASSVGDYIITDYVDTDYVFQTLDLKNSFTLQAEGTLNFIRANITATFTLSAQGQDLDLATATQSSQFSLAVTATRLRVGTAAVNSTATQNTQGNAVFTQSKSLSCVANITAQGNFNTANGSVSLTAFYTQVQVAGKLFFGRFTDYRWDSFAESEYIDRTWDEWFGDAWDQGGVIYTVSTVFKAVGGYRAQAVGFLDSAFTQQQNITIGISKSITATASQSTQGNYTTFASGSYNSAFEQANVFFDRFRGVAIDGTPLEHTARFTQSSTGNAVYSPAKQLDSLFDQSVQGNAIYDSSSSQSSQFAHSVNANVIYDLGYGELFEAFNTQLSAGRLITLPDPWNVIKVKQEIRTLVIPIESRSLPVKEETRVNSVEAETRGIKVLEETRAYKIFKPQFANRSSIPRIRQES